MLVHGAKMYPRLRVFNEGPLLNLSDGLPELLLSIHDKRTVPRDGLFERFPGYQEKADPLLAGLNGHFIAAIEQDEGAVAELLRWHREPCNFRIHLSDAFGRDCAGLRGVAKRARSGKHVRERVTGGFDRQRLATARCNRHIQIPRIGGDAVHWTCRAPKASADHANPGSIVIDHL